MTIESKYRYNEGGSVTEIIEITYTQSEWIQKKEQMPKANIAPITPDQRLNGFGEDTYR